MFSLRDTATGTMEDYGLTGLMNSVDVEIDGVGFGRGRSDSCALSSHFDELRQCMIYRQPSVVTKAA